MPVSFGTVVTSDRVNYISNSLLASVKFLLNLPCTYSSRVFNMSTLRCIPRLVVQ